MSSGADGAMAILIFILLVFLWWLLTIWLGSGEEESKITNRNDIIYNSYFSSELKYNKYEDGYNIDDTYFTRKLE